MIISLWYLYFATFYSAVAWKLYCTSVWTKNKNLQRPEVYTRSPWQAPHPPPHEARVFYVFFCFSLVFFIVLSLITEKVFPPPQKKIIEQPERIFSIYICYATFIDSNLVFALFVYQRMHFFDWMVRDQNAHDFYLLTLILLGGGGGKLTMRPLFAQL